MGATLRGCGSVHAGARFFRGSTSGDLLFQSATVLQVRPALALEAQLGFLPWRSLIVTLALAFVLTAPQAEFTVEGAPGATRASPILEGQLRLGAGLGADFSKF